MKNRQKLGWPLYQIDPRRQKEDTGRKINKIDIAPTPYFCWIRAPPDAQIRQRSKNRAPVIWVPEPPWAPRTLGTPAGAGDGGRSPPQFRIQDSGFKIQDSGSNILDSGFKIQSGKGLGEFQSSRTQVKIYEKTQNSKLVKNQVNTIRDYQVTPK